MRVASTAVLAFMLAACQPASPSSGNAAVTPNAGSAEPQQPATPAATATSAARSEYSSLKDADCTVLDRDAESGSVLMQCPGVAGFTLRLHDSDARMSLDVVAPNGPPQPLDFWSVGSAGFSHLGDQAEWRFAPGAETPGALIVRFDAFEQPERPQQATSYLLVSKVATTGSCVVTKIPPGPAQNEQARAMADVADERPCLRPGD